MEHRSVNARAVTLLNVLNAVHSELLDICLDNKIDIHERVEIMAELLPILNLSFNKIEEAYQDYADGDLTLEAFESYIKGYLT